MEDAELGLFVHVLKNIEVPARSNKRLLGCVIAGKRHGGAQGGVVLDGHDHRPLGKQGREPRLAFGRQPGGVRSNPTRESRCQLRLVHGNGREKRVEVRAADVELAAVSHSGELAVLDTALDGRCAAKRVIGRLGDSQEFFGGWRELGHRQHLSDTDGGFRP